MMLQMSRRAAIALQSTVDEVTVLAYRIREWEYLDIRLHSVENSFKPFLAKVQLIETSGDLSAQLQTLTRLWTHCQDTDIVELSGSVRNLEYIHQPVGSSNANYPQVKEGVASLVTIGTDIQYALLHGLLDDLKKQTEDFNKALHGQIANPRIFKQHELDLLCEVASRLRIQLDQNFDQLKEVLEQLVQSLQKIGGELEQLKDQLAKAKVLMPPQSDLAFTSIETFVDQTLNYCTLVMSQFTDARKPSLQSIIDEVTNRSYRLRELEYLEIYLQKTCRSFSSYTSWLQQAPSNWALNAPTLIELWALCRNVDIPELNSFVQSLKYIQEPFETDKFTYYPKFRENVTALVNIGGTIYEALIDSSFKKVQEQSYQFQTTLTGQLTTRRTTMNDEVELLCQALHELSEQLKSIAGSETQAL